MVGVIVQVIDMRTTMLFISAIHLVFGLLIWSYRWRGGSNAALATWSIANVVAAVAWLLMALRGQVPVFLSVPVANTLLTAGWTLLLVGMRRFAGRPAHPWRFTILPAVVFVLFTAVPLVRDNLGARVLVVNICLMIVLVTLVIEAVGDRRAEPLRSRVVVVVAVSAAVVPNIARAVQGQMLAPSKDFLRSGAVQEVGIFVQGIALLGWSIGLLLMYQERLENQLRDSVRRDPLTGLLNRRGFAEERLLRRPNGTGREAVLVLDLDDFKKVNDTYGHDCGDELLQRCAHRVRDWMRPGDLAARYGGEEFCLLISVGDAGEAVLRAEDLRCAIAQTAAETIVAGRSGPISVTVSIGVAVAERPGVVPVADLIAGADEAMYRAKRAGRNRVVLADGSLADRIDDDRPLAPGPSSWR